MKKGIFILCWQQCILLFWYDCTPVWFRTAQEVTSSRATGQGKRSVYYYLRHFRTYIWPLCLVPSASHKSLRSERGGNSHPFLPILGLPSTFMVLPTKIGFKRNINNSFPRQLDYNIWILFLITGNWIFSNSVLLYSFGSNSYSLFQGYWIRQACESKGQVIGKTKISLLIK